jgi:hypothetical protein
MWSLTEAIQAAGLEGESVSLAGHVFGYRRGRVPRAPDGSTTSMSLADWAALRNNERFNLNIIAVGSDSFTTSMWDEVDTLVHRMRQIYARIDVGVQHVRHFGVLAADANGLDIITTSDEVDDLRESWAVDNGAIDLLIPAGWDRSPSALNGLLGRSKLDGPCLGEKDDKGAAGAAVGLSGPLLSSRPCAPSRTTPPLPASSAPRRSWPSPTATNRWSSTPPASPRSRPHSTASGCRPAHATPSRRPPAATPYRCRAPRCSPFLPRQAA